MSRAWIIVPSLLVLLVASDPATATKVTSSTFVSIRDCGLGVVTVTGRHEMRVSDPDIDVVGETVEVVGELWRCNSGVLNELLRPPCYESAIVLTESRSLVCYENMDQLCRTLSGVQGISYGGIAPFYPRSSQSQCKAPDCGSDWDPPEILTTPPLK